MKRLVSDFEYPLATGLRVPAASVGGEVALSGGTGVVNPLMRPAPVPSSTPNGNRTVATVTLCCVLLLSSVGCDPKEDGSKEQGGSSRSSDMAGCHVKPNNPHQSGQPPAKRGEIVGKVQFWCDKPVDRVVGSARLQRKDGRRWVTVRNAVGRRPVRNPEKGKRYVTQGAASCQEGTYRTAGFGYALRDGKLYEVKSWIYSHTVTDPCGAR